MYRGRITRVLQDGMSEKKKNNKKHPLQKPIASISREINTK